MNECNVYIYDGGTTPRQNKAKAKETSVVWFIILL
jgi:hypothetical protein